MIKEITFDLDGSPGVASLIWIKSAVSNEMIPPALSFASMVTDAAIVVLKNDCYLILIF